LLVPRHIRLTVFDTHIYDLSMSSGRLELKEDDVEDRHCVCVRVEDVVKPVFGTRVLRLVSSQSFNVCVSLAPYR
jgi:hypothetical protein